MEWYIWLGIAVGGLIAALIIEDSREWIIEKGEYIISFEWIGDLVDFFGSAFEDIGELSITGIIFAAIGGGILFIFRKNLIDSFLQYYQPVPRTIWTIATYAVTIIVCYFLGKGFENG